MPGRVWKLTRFEMAKLSRQWTVYACLALTIGLTDIGVLLTDRQREGYWKPTGFDCLANGVSFAFLLLPMMLVVIGSRSLSSEASGGTMRTVMTRPVTRTDYVLAKILSLVALSFVAYLIVLFAADVFSWWRADRYRALYQTYPDGPGKETAYPTPLRTVPELFGETVRNLPLLYLPLLSSALFGLFISALIDNEGVSASVAAVLYLPYAMAAGLHPTYFNHVAPSRQASWLAQYWAVVPLEKLQNYVLGYSAGFRWDPADYAKAIWVPLVYIAVFSGTSVLVFRNRDILV